MLGLSSINATAPHPKSRIPCPVSRVPNEVESPVHESAAQFRMDGPPVAGVSGRVGCACAPHGASSTNSSSCSPLACSKSSSIASWNGFPNEGRSYSVILKILLGSLLVDHTGGIESTYYLIYFVPVVTAAMYFDLWATLAWTALTSTAYCSFVIWALLENIDPWTGHRGGGNGGHHNGIGYPEFVFLPGGHDG